jgi:hypothetical protein
MKRSAYIVLSALLSLLAHALLLGFADRILIRTRVTVPPPLLPMPISVVSAADLVMRKPTIRQKLAEEAQRRLRDEAISGPRVEQILEKQDLALANPDPKVRLKDLGDSLLKPNLADPPKSAMPTAPPPKIIEIDGDSLSPDRLALTRPMQAKVERFDLPQSNLPSLLPPGPFQGGIGDTFDVSMRFGSLPAVPGLRPGDLEGLDDRLGDIGTSFGPRGGTPGLDELTDPERLKRNPLGLDLEMLDAFVTVTVVVYPEPGSGGYFRADISPNRRSDSLPDVVKDVLLVIDHSTSISGAKLEQFRQGTLEALQCLNPQDRFDVVSFTDQPQRCFGELRPVAPETIRMARDYVAGIIRGGMTDVFGGLAPFVRESNTDPSRPLNVFLMSDGVSTVNIRKEDDFVRGIVGMNPGNVSIFSLSAGSKANLFLLQFLGYLNRGFSLHEEALADFKSSMLRYLSTHSSLIVADLHYRATGGLDAGIFPKRLPHLYRGETLSIFGRYPSGTEELTLSLVGRDGLGKHRELLFRRKLSECPPAGRELAQQWGAQKVFHLIGQRTLSTDAEVRARHTAEIGAIAKQYSLYVPY